MHAKSRGQVLARRQTRRRQTNTLLGLTMVAVVMAVMVGVGLYHRADIEAMVGGDRRPRQASKLQDPIPDHDIARNTEKVTQTTRTRPNLPSKKSPLNAPGSEATTDTSIFGDQGTTDPQAFRISETRRVQAEGVEPSRWRIVNEPFITPVRVGEVRIVNDKVVQKEDGRLEFNAEARVVNHQVVESATAELAVVDFSDRVLARLDIPLTMISRGNPQKINVLIPRRLSKQTMRISWSVRGAGKQKRIVPIKGALIEVVWENRRVHLRVMAANSSDQKLNGASFVVAALDKDGRKLAQWRMNWSWPIEPRERIALIAETKLESLSGVHHWDIVGVGNPEKGDTASADDRLFEG